MSRALTANELRGLFREQFNAEVVELRGELFDLRFAVATEQLELYRRLRKVYKGITRVYTVLQGHSLGTVDEPVIQEK